MWFVKIRVIRAKVTAMTGDQFPTEIWEFLSQQRQTSLLKSFGGNCNRARRDEKKNRRCRERAYRFPKRYNKIGKLYCISERRACIERVYMNKYLYRVGTVLFINDSFSAHPRYTHFRAGKGRNWGFCVKQKNVYSVFYVLATKYE